MRIQAKLGDMRAVQIDIDGAVTVGECDRRKPVLACVELDVVGDGKFGVELFRHAVNYELKSGLLPSSAVLER